MEEIEALGHLKMDQVCPHCGKTPEQGIEEGDLIEDALFNAEALIADQMQRGNLTTGKYTLRLIQRARASIVKATTVPGRKGGR